jgi:hypothetical protein
MNLTTTLESDMVIAHVLTHKLLSLPSASLNLLPLADLRAFADLDECTRAQEMIRGAKFSIQFDDMMI